MPDFSFSARTKLDKSKERSYFRLRVDTADHAGDVAGLIDNINSNGVRYQVSQVVKEERFVALDKALMGDYSPWYVIFYDSDHPDKKLKLTIPFCKKDITNAQMAHFLDTFILKGVQFQDQAERAAALKATPPTNPDDCTWYNANAYPLSGARGKVRDVTTADHSSDEATAPADMSDPAVQ